MFGDATARGGSRDHGGAAPKTLPKRVGDSSRTPAFHHVLLAVSDLGMTRGLIQALHERRLVPALALSREQVAAYAGRGAFDLTIVALESDTQALSGLLTGIAQRAEPILVLGHSGDDVAGMADELLAPETPPEEVVRRAHLLIDVNRPVNLPEPLRWGPLELDVRRRTAAWNGQPLELTVYQFRIMEVLVLAAGAVVGFEELSRRVWGDTAFDDRDRLVGHIKRIRERLRRREPHEPFLISARGEGFRLRDDRSSDGTNEVIVLE